MEYKCGYVAVLGKPNAGKSSLVNALVGEKVAIVSSKPQTTRNNILGILTRENYQLILVDTPGIHKAKNQLDKYMMKNVRSAIGGAYLNVYLIDATKPLGEEEFNYIKSLSEKEIPVVVCLTKIDLISRENCLPTLDKLSQIKNIKEIIPISSMKNKNLHELTEKMLEFIPSSPVKNFEFDEDYYTDKSVKFIASEIIREKALYNLEKEIPHGVSVVITIFNEKKDLTVIEADLICEKNSHKGMIIGSHGSMLRKIGESARIELEQLLGTKVLLKLWVRVKENWREQQNNLNDFGYNPNNVNF